MADPFASAKYRDPVTTFGFAVELEKLGSMGMFQQVSGLNNEQPVTEFNHTTASGKNYLQKLPGAVTFSDIVLKRAISEDKKAWDWRQSVIDGKIKDSRVNGSVVAFDYDNNEVARWNFENAWPSKINLTSIAAEGKDAIMEELTIVIEKLVRAK